MVENTDVSEKALDELLFNIGESVFGEAFIGGGVSHSPPSGATATESGVFGQLYVHSPSLTDEERGKLESRGLRLVENASHIVENPAMDASVQTIDRDELADAAEIEQELIVELTHAAESEARRRYE